MPAKSILVVDDDALFRDLLQETLVRREYDVDVAENGPEAVQKMEGATYDLVLSDIRMPGMDGIEVLERARKLQPEAPVVMITGNASIDNVVEAMQKGASDYIQKGGTIDEIEIRIEKALETGQIRQENQHLRSELKARYDFGNMVGSHKSMQELFDHIQIVAQSRSTVLIQGESGTGKELVTRAIHYNSTRSSGPFIKLNCAALPQDLIESELFGHEKGAFTGAIKQTKGRFELADGGTLLLDEISEIQSPLQAKLLRVLQEREFERIGSGTSIKIDVRMVATTNRNLQDEIAKGNFREDLFYRLNVIPIKIPTLHERKEDIPELATHFIAKYNAENEKNIQGLSERALELLMKYNWPGNIRELENYIERAIVICQEDQISEKHLPLDILANETASGRGGGGIEVGTTVREMEKQLILKTLEAHDGNRTSAADVLGISARTLRNKLHEYGLAGIYRKGGSAGSEDDEE
ncbi:MAG: sigma-54 dependent transcriptional regulator [Candidatus Latescibacteria bacterium]|jgi:DNA-binding NtrC family response regulator|nr:sigma-54 dependent transcriptional regulator [Candidatus Latescibacterota bacterium]